MTLRVARRRRSEWPGGNRVEEKIILSRIPYFWGVK